MAEGIYRPTPRLRFRQTPNDLDYALMRIWHLLPDEEGYVNPLFGAGHGFDFANQIEQSKKNRHGMYLADGLNLALHLGDIQFDEHMYKELMLIHSGAPRAVLDKGARDCYRRRISPVRQYCETVMGIYFRYMPQIATQTDKRSGQVYIVSNGYYGYSCIPMDVQTALGYRMDENAIKLIAEQAIYLLQLQCANRSIKEVKELRRKRDGWFEHVSVGIKMQFLEVVNNRLPCIAAHKETQQLLLPMGK